VRLKSPRTNEIGTRDEHNYAVKRLLNEKLECRKKCGINAHGQNETGIKKKAENLVVKFKVHEIADNHHKLDHHHYQQRRQKENAEVNVIS
jgi:hypothetical protein